MVKVTKQPYSSKPKVSIHLFNELYEVEGSSLDRAFELIIMEIFKQYKHSSRTELMENLNISRAKLYKLLKKYNVPYKQTRVFERKHF